MSKNYKVSELILNLLFKKPNKVCECGTHDDSIGL